MSYEQLTANLNKTIQQTERQLFLQHLAQTSNFPLMLEIERAKGIYLYDKNGKRYIDIISGISVSNLGHCRLEIVDAVKKQAETYMHLMVYGEYVQSPQVKLSCLLAQNLPEELQSVYLVNSGSEANEGALKLAKRFTGRTEIIAFKNAYHGSTHGALSIMGCEDFKQNFRPLLPDIRFLDFNDCQALNRITEKTACVIIEPIQGEAGIIIPKNNFLQKLRKKCTETGTLLIFDEVQTGFGRTGSLFAFQEFGVTPDIMTLAKGMGGGMPIGAFIASNEIMNSLTHNPILGHITTFGGHPVSSAAALASLTVLLNENYIETAQEKGELFKELLTHPAISQVRGKGLMLAIELESFEMVQKIIKKCLEYGLITDWFLFNSKSIRIAPPLIITKNQIKEICSVFNRALSTIQ